MIVVGFCVDGVVGGDASDQGNEQSGEGEARGQARGGFHGFWVAGLWGGSVVYIHHERSGVCKWAG